MAEVRDTPIISERSRKLVEKQQREAKIEDTLLGYKTQKEQKAMSRLQSEVAETAPGVPRITNYAASLCRDGDVGNRLYNKAFEYKAKRAQQVEQQMAEIEDMAKGGARSRRIASYSYEATMGEPEVRTLPIELDLLRREEERKAHFDQMLMDQEEEEVLMHYPRINAMSDLIAQQLPENSVERLLKPKVVWEAPPEDDDPSHTYKPKVDRESNRINEERKQRGEVPQDDSKRNEYLYEKSEENYFRREQARKRALDKEMEECTFQPNINKESRAMQGQGHGATSVVARTQIWQKQRNARMRQEREAQEKKEMEECTFRPNIRSYKPKKTKKPIEDTAYGIEEHLDRQAVARKRDEDAKTTPHSTGENWKHELTKPKEFSFNHKVKIKALAKPITPTKSQMQQQAIEDGSANQALAYSGYSQSMASTGSASAEWMRRAAEKETSEQAHAAAGMTSPRYYASDALNMHTGTPRGQTGEDTHVARMKAARAERQEKQTRAKSTTGDNWKGGTTKPVEFKFADSKAVRVRALHKPVSPMLS